jgi:hypothetical protein
MAAFLRPQARLSVLFGMPDGILILGERGHPKVGAGARPYKETDDKLSINYGCDFFEMKGDGSFEGILLDMTSNMIH